MLSIPTKSCPRPHGGARPDGTPHPGTCDSWWGLLNLDLPGPSPRQAGRKLARRDQRQVARPLIPVRTCPPPEQEARALLTEAGGQSTAEIAGVPGPVRARGRSTSLTTVGSGSSTNDRIGGGPLGTRPLGDEFGRVQVRVCQTPQSRRSATGHPLIEASGARLRRDHDLDCARRVKDLAFKVPPTPAGITISKKRTVVHPAPQKGGEFLGRLEGSRVARSPTQYRNMGADHPRRSGPRPWLEKGKRRHRGGGDSMFATLDTLNPSFMMAVSGRPRGFVQDTIRQGRPGCAG